MSNEKMGRWQNDVDPNRNMCGYLSRRAKRDGRSEAQEGDRRPEAKVKCQPRRDSAAPANRGR